MKLAVKTLYLVPLFVFLSGNTFAAELYGNPWNAAGLGNTSTKYCRTVSFRFRAKYTGMVDRLRFYNIHTAPGYFAGDGGDLFITIRPDDGTSNHLPVVGTILGSYLMTEPLQGGKFPLITFDDPISLTAGTLYHILFSNTASNCSGENYTSINHIGNNPPFSPRQPSISDTDLASLFSDQAYPPSTWFLRTIYTPLYDLGYTDGKAQGNGLMEAWIYETAVIYISGNHKVRQTMAISDGDKSIVSASVRLARRSGDGNLTIRLERSDGILVEEGTITGTSIPVETNPHRYVWVTLNFTAPRILVSGTSYRLVMSAPSDTIYDITPMRDGTGYGFHPSTVFEEGRSEYTTDGTNWKGWLYWGKDNRNEGDLQFYFTIGTEIQDNPPVVSITSPTVNASYITDTTPITTLGGTASDDGGVSSVTWVNTRTTGSGSASGCSGQMSCDWTISSMALDEGDNVIEVTAIDTGSNTSMDTITITLDTVNPDSESPTVPQDLTATALIDSGISFVALEWNVSTDNIGPITYRIQRCEGVDCSNFADLSTVTSVVFQDDALLYNVFYRYRIRAEDAIPNVSAYSAIAEVLTLGVGVIPPQPANLSTSALSIVTAIPSVPSTLSTSATGIISIPPVPTGLSTLANATVSFPSPLVGLTTP